jgi:hypothetical protein
MTPAWHNKTNNSAPRGRCLGGLDAAGKNVYIRLRSKLSDARMEHELARLTLEKHQQDDHAEWRRRLRTCNAFRWANTLPRLWTFH